MRGISPLIFHRTDITQIEMPASSIIEYFNNIQIGFVWPLAQPMGQDNK